MHSHRCQLDTIHRLGFSGNGSRRRRRRADPPASSRDKLRGRLSRASFSPSTKPISLSPRRNPRIQSGVESGDLGSSNPITGMAGCCPRASNGHDAAAPPRSEISGSLDGRQVPWIAGIGMTAEQQARLFQEFAQADSPLRKKSLRFQIKPRTLDLGGDCLAGVVRLELEYPCANDVFEKS
jgi:hypothetical protein